MVDRRAHKKAPKMESCPVRGCGGMMHLAFDTYRCNKCRHFRQDMSLQDIVERDGGHLKFCECLHCKEANAL